MAVGHSSLAGTSELSFAEHRTAILRQSHYSLSLAGEESVVLRSEE